MHWKRIVHLSITVLLVIFIIWYYFPGNRIIRGNDVCGVYANQTGQICSCTPVPNGITKTFYPNLSVYQSIPWYTNPQFNVLSNVNGG